MSTFVQESVVSAASAPVDISIQGPAPVEISPIIISIDGNIGSGKSTLYGNLKEHYKNDVDVYFVPEPVDEWEEIKDEEGTTILANFYKDPKKHAFKFQMMAYISRLKLLRQCLKKKQHKYIISERSVLTDKNVFAQMLYDDGCIKHDEYQIYTKWFYEFLDEVDVGKMVYVIADPKICHGRVIKRGREGEVIPLEYLTRCHDYHNNWISKLDSKTILKIDANVDTSHDNKIRDAWVKQIDKFIKG